MEDLIRDQADGHHPDIRAALDLLLSAGGKRIRPTITILIGKMLSAPKQELLRLAAAIELLHTATLVHDDLIDSSLLRRGSPTLNSQWSTGATVLTGDFLFACAAKLAAETNSVEVMRLFSQTLVVIVNGEITQLFDGNNETDRQKYFNRIYAKTASLFETSAATAAMISSTDDRVVEKMKRFGHEIGMAFQIVDDILDITGDPNTVGKPIGSDLRQGLITLPAITFIENNPDHPVVKRWQKGDHPANDENVEELVSALKKTTAISESLETARKYMNHGLDVLKEMPTNPEHAALIELSHYIVDRKL